jgi:hypothetical protein
LPDKIFGTAELLLLVRLKRSRFADPTPVWANADHPGRTRELRCASQNRCINTPLPRLLSGRVGHEREYAAEKTIKAIAAFIALTCKPARAPLTFDKE